MKIALLLSGGVDSSVALMRLKVLHPDAHIVAYYLKIWLEDELVSLGDCPWREDLEYAQGVCTLAGIPLEIMSMQREYRERVIAYTVEELKNGRTPSPDIFCNRRIKFGAFLDGIGDSFDKVATGHYAMVNKESDGLYRIRRSPDPIKDQTYFLSHLLQEQVAMALFPVGDLMKDEVRQLATELNLPNKTRKDSQGICFLGKIQYPEFVRHYLGEKKGPILEAGTNRILGYHQGTWFYTIGQRTGLGLSGGPWYVVSRDMGNNTVTVSHNNYMNDAVVKHFIVDNPNWIANEPHFPARVCMKLRHGPKLISGCIETLPSFAESEHHLSVQMDEGDCGVAPGQFAVFYKDDICLGGAVIDRAFLQSDLLRKNR